MCIKFGDLARCHKRDKREPPSEVPLAPAAMKVTIIPQPPPFLRPLIQGQWRPLCHARLDSFETLKAPEGSPLVNTSKFSPCLTPSVSRTAGTPGSSTRARRFRTHLWGPRD